MKACSSALHATSHLLKNGIIGLEVIPTPTALKNIPQVQTFLESQSLLARKQSREAVDLLLNLSDCSFRSDFPIALLSSNLECLSKQAIFCIT